MKIEFEPDAVAELQLDIPWLHKTECLPKFFPAIASTDHSWIIIESVIDQDTTRQNMVVEFVYENY